MKQTEQLSDIATSFTDRIMQLNSKTKCSDPKVKQLKTDLEKILQQLITTIKQGLNSIN
jgi:ribosome recycling factor